jgi:plastocyanin
MSLRSLFSKPTWLFCAALFVRAASPATAGDIVGRVELTEKGGKKASDLSDVVIYLENAKGRPKAGREVLTMKSKTFTPHVLAVGVGTTVEFPNEDPILHNVFSVSGEGFDLGLYKRPKSGSRTFDKPGVYTIYCNIHPQMSALVLVRDNPHFAKASKDGAFRIEGVPAGEYKVKAFHERAGEGAPVTVKVAAAGEAAVTLSLDAASYKRVQHKNKFGKAYGREAY